MSASEYLRTQIINDYLKAGTIYLALFSTIPVSPDPGTEIVGGSYARQVCAIGTEADGVVMNSAVINYTGMPATTVRGGGLFDAVSGGNYLGGAGFTMARAVGAGTIYTVAIGDIVIRVR